MKKYINGILAGLAATIVLSALMMIKGMMGMMPDINLVAMLASKMGGSLAAGWMAHFMIGALFYGVIYSAFFNKLPLNTAARGAAIGAAGWIVMMIAVMPMMGAGLFGLNLASGVMAPIVTLMLHLIYGVVLSAVYRRL